jgi:signal transduction histidine kinase
LQALETGLSTEIESLRILMTDLRPPVLDERGLSQALNDYGAALMLRQQIVCDFDLDIETRLDPEIESILYRIAQEALTNVAKHSRAGHVLVRCRARDGEFEMEVTDDGVGFDVSATDMSGMDGHLGLASIRERIEFAGGRCNIDSTVGGGTRVSVSLDLEGDRDAEVARIAS